MPSLKFKANNHFLFNYEEIYRGVDESHLINIDTDIHLTNDHSKTAGFVVFIMVGSEPQ